MTCGKETHVGFLKAERLCNAVRILHRPPPQSDEISSANVLHEVKVHGIQKHDNHDLNGGVPDDSSNDIGNDRCDLCYQTRSIPTLKARWKKQVKECLYEEILLPRLCTVTLDTETRPYPTFRLPLPHRGEMDSLPRDENLQSRYTLLDMEQ